MRSLRNTNVRTLSLAFICSLLFITICSKSSFLYPMNDWVDTQCFFTVGKAMVNGKVLYADIYEQKGPLLYFLFSLAYLISDSSFLGVYILEVISFSGFLFFSAKTAYIYLKDIKAVYLLIPFLAMIITSSSAFAHGGSAEEFSLVFLAYSLYDFLKAVHEDSLLNNRRVFLHGVCAACVLWIKFTFLGFYIGLVIFVLIWYGTKKKWEALVQSIAFFLLGFIAVTIPVLSYFVLTDSMFHLFKVYFYDNIFVYSLVNTESSLAVKISTIILYSFMGLVGFGKRAIANPRQYIDSALSIVAALWAVLKRTKAAAVVLLSGLFLILTTFGGGRFYVYYPLIFAIYTPVGIAVLISGVLKKEINFEMSQRFFRFAMVFSCIFLSLFAFSISGNTYLIKYNKAEMPQYQFAKWISKVDNADLLNYGFLDGGFYFAADVSPNSKYFCTLNNDLTEMNEEMDAYVEEGKGDFIITRNKSLEQYSINTQYYQYVDQSAFYFEGDDHTYYLYQHI